MSVPSTPIEIQYLFRSSNPLSLGEFAHIETLLQEAESRPERDALANARKVADLRYLLSSVRRVPEDILAIIFELVYYAGNVQREARSLFREDYYCWTTRPLRLLGSVCSKWRSATQNSCAQLWTQVCLVPSSEGYRAEGYPTLSPDPSTPHAVESQIRYSHDLPLDICIPFEMEDPSSAFNLLRKESHRWRSAYIVFDDMGYWGAFRDHPEAITLDAPELIDLKLKLEEGSYVIEEEDHILPFTLIAPKLKKAEFWYGKMDRFIEPANFPWEQLTHASFISANPPQCNLLMHLIQGTVEFLSLLDTWLDDDDFKYVENPFPIIFSRLHTLELRHIGEIPGMTSTLFQWSTATALRSLTWETFGVIDYEDDMVEFLDRSECRIEHFVFTHDAKEGLAPHISRMLDHMPYLLSLGLGGWSPSRREAECDQLIDVLSTGPDANRSHCPLLVETYFVDKPGYL